jgi:outer membrane receptor protein involved in Fe transport
VYLTYENRVQNGIISSLKASLSYQQQKEGRQIQKETTNPLTRESDDVHTAGFTLQMNSTFGRHFLTYGTDIYFDEVGSERRTIDPATDSEEVDPRGRYPDGAKYDSYGFYIQDEVRISPRWTMIPGIRYSYFTTCFSIPDSDNQTLSSDDINQSFRAFTGNLGFIYKLTGRMYLNMNVGQAFRAPNLSDISKLGESKGNVYEVPNPDLTPEKMLSVDAGFKLDFNRVKADVSAFYATISDLLASGDATYQGASTIERNDVIYKVKTKQNIGTAFIRGIEAGIHVQCHDHLFFRSNVSSAYGHNLTHDEPVGGIPPLFGLVGLKWQKPIYYIDMFIRFAREQNRLSADDLDDPRIPEGGTPGWYTINFRAGLLIKNIGNLRFTVENILDYNYREHGSGINGPGRNFIASFEVKR